MVSRAEPHLKFPIGTLPATFEIIGERLRIIA